MANPEHLEILKQGVELWNKWRGENSRVQPDLSGLDFSNLYLGNVNFSEAKLLGTSFEKASLVHANLIEADLSFSNLQKANFMAANLSLASLVEANLRGANLFMAVLSHTDLTAANVELANFEFTVIVDSYLLDAIGLDKCVHSGRCFIDHLTVAQSEDLPLSFLRGCGLPDEIIEVMTSEINNPDNFPSCFISYSSKDQKFADSLYTKLQNVGVRCWLASEDLKIGAKIRIGIDESIRVHDKLLLVLSKNSVASDWVEQEVETALERERKEKRLILFPIQLDDAVMKIKGGWPALIRNTRNIGDFRKRRSPESFYKAFSRLLRDLKAEEKQA